MKIAGIDFPSPLLSALRDGELVIFAGAGVSMGEPACLPSFKELAEKIAQGTSEVLQGGEEDRFLGRLHDKGVKVHKRAVRELSHNNPKPTALHKNLLRLYQKSEQVRVVTTNFDLLFEEAAQDVFGTVPKVSQAPELPQARDFYGIAHIHGDLNHPQDLVLTDKDFGVAYMNKGWAKDFLVELFGHLKVLFVGYSHNDIILTYLARGLLVDGTQPRFALTDVTDDSDLQRWKSLGIEPVIYPKSDANDHSRLYEGVRRLADRANFSISDWQREITELAEKPPPSLDEEAADLIADSLSDAERTRFFTQAATSSEWIDWLSRRGHLVPLFGPADLSEPSQVLATWLAENFARDHANKLFLLISQYQMQLHPHFWFVLQRAIGKEGGKPLDKNTLARWVSLLLKTDPLNVNWYSDITPPSVWWLEISKRCNDQKLMPALLDIFAVMSKSRLLLEPDFARSSDDGNDPPPRANLPLVCDHHILNEIWKQGLKPNLDQVAKPLLSLVVQRIEDQHRTLCAWKHANNKWDHVSNNRWAIESHEYNMRPTAIDVLIDAARDSLERLASNQGNSAALWCNLLIDSEVPLLRRLAIYTLSVRSDLTADDKIDWLLTHIGLHDPAAHHETEKVVCQTYPKASPAQRENLIVSHRRPDEDDSERHFEWLSRLHRLDPTCPLAQNELDEIAARCPQFRRQEAPVAARSSWSVEKLLARTVDEWLEELLASPTTIDSDGIQTVVRDATKQKPDWGLDLAEALASKENWETKLWSTLIHAWEETELDENQGRTVLNLLNNANLHQKYGRDVAYILYGLVKNGGRSCALELLPQANKIAAALWANLDQGHPYEEKSDWLISATNHPVGTLVHFWLESLFLWWKHQDPAPEQLDSEYLAALSKIVEDRTIVGRLGKSVLADYFSSLLEIDESWTKRNLLPLFFRKNHSDADDYKAIWDGFLTRRRLTPFVAELLSEAFLDAVQHINSELSDQNRRDSFITCYTVMLVYFALDSSEKWISEFFAHSDTEARHTFADEIGHRLHRMNETQQQEQWNRWLKRYWIDRLDGVPKPLESDEIKRMTDWLPHLKGVFPEAVEMAIQMPQSESGGKRESWVIFKLESSDLPEMHPEATAKLVLYIRPSLPPTDLAYGHEKQIQRELIGRLLQSPLPPELKTKLQELDAQLMS